MKMDNHKKSAVLNYRVYGRDMTEYKLIEKQEHRHNLLVNLQKISNQELTSALTHELAQPLTIINNFLIGCSLRLKSGNYEATQLIDVLNQAAQQMQHIATIIHRNEDYLSSGKAQDEWIDINFFLKEALSIIQWFFPAQKDCIELQTSDQQIILSVNPSRLELVVLNLICHIIDHWRDNSDQKNQKIIIKTLKKAENLSFQIVDFNSTTIPSNRKKTSGPIFSDKKNSLGIKISTLRKMIEQQSGDLTISQLHGRIGFEIILPIITPEITALP